MHTPTLLHYWLDPLLSCIHATRLGTLFDVVAGCIAGTGLSITTVGRRLDGPTTLKHKIKRADRLIGNRHLYAERHSIYLALCQLTVGRIPEPVILVDWSDLKADQSLHLLRASLAVGGRSLTLYEEVHRGSKLGNRKVQERFLQALARLLPPGAAPIVVADSGFRVPFFRAVEALGWRWVGRLQGRDYVQLRGRWVGGKSLFKRATTAPQRLGVGLWVKSNPLAALMVLIRLPACGRHGKTVTGRRSRSRKSLKAANTHREPWLLVASPRFADRPPKVLVRLYRQRMQIEESFRDMKSLYFGQGYDINGSRDLERVAILVMIASLAAILLWMIGAAAERLELHHGMHASSSKRRVYSLPFLATLILQITHDVIDLSELPAPDELIAECHQALMMD
jgi:Transposase DDE domain